MTSHDVQHISPHIKDDDIRKPKIKVEIKPISAIQKPVSNDGSSSVFSASVDELRSAVTALEIAPPPPTVSLSAPTLAEDKWEFIVIFLASTSSIISSILLQFLPLSFLVIYFRSQS